MSDAASLGFPILPATGRELARIITAQGAVPIAAILGIGRNYAEHAKEQGASVPDAPMVFSKNPASVISHGERIIIPRACSNQDQLDFEGELAIVIGGGGLGGEQRLCRDVSEAEALSFVLGYTIANDVSARWWQKQGSGGQFFRGKSFDTFCPIGPSVIPARAIENPDDLALETRINGEVMQRDRTSSMVFSCRKLIAELSRDMTLMPGTIILTGTPSGVGMARTPPRWLEAGDVIEIQIEHLGTLRNTVAAASSAEARA
jgi:2-keto-4-pentenoate hydratase/2-oxohepta-3-ene-1,7-dioic acid hydratase in catechol pathway